MMKRAVVIAALSGCWSSSQPKVDPKAPTDVDVTVASVSLADDCPEAKTADEPVHGSCAEGSDCNFAHANCEQTTIQLSVSSKAGAAKIQIKRIELLDKSGKQLGTLEPRKPTTWNESGEYRAWDEVVPAGKTMTASYSLTSPDWDKLGGRRDPATTYTVRVIVTIGDHDRTIEKEATVAANVEAPVMT